jgi:hypothetical protein
MMDCVGISSGMITSVSNGLSPPSCYRQANHTANPFGPLHWHYPRTDRSSLVRSGLFIAGPLENPDDDVPLLPRSLLVGLEDLAETGWKGSSLRPARGVTWRYPVGLAWLKIFWSVCQWMSNSRQTDRLLWPSTRMRRLISAQFSMFIYTHRPHGRGTTMGWRDPHRGLKAVSEAMDAPFSDRAPATDRYHVFRAIVT